MKNLIYILFMVFTFCSCATDNAGFDPISKKEMMESWAWKIFIFTDEGETIPVETTKNNFENAIKDKPIFVEDVWKIDTNHGLFLNNQKVALEDRIGNTDLAETAMTKFSSYKNKKTVPDNQILNTFSEETKRKK